jgi:hypothetical protein
MFNPLKIKGRFMKNKLMLALLVSAPVAVRAMQPVPAAVPTANTAPAAPVAKQVVVVTTVVPAHEDHLAHLKSVFNVQNERALANKLRNFIPHLEELAENDLITALQKLGVEGGLAPVHQAVAQALPQAAAVAAPQSRDVVVAPSANTALQAAVSILSKAYAVATDPANQQVIKQVENEVAQSGCCGLVANKK